VGFVNVMMARYPGAGCRSSPTIMINRYYGWYVFSTTWPPPSARGRSSPGGRGGKPIIITEYGADTLAGHRSLKAGPWARSTSGPTR
jgi:beta-glucuronidase